MHDAYARGNMVTDMVWRFSFDEKAKSMINDERDGDEKVSTGDLVKTSLPGFR